MQFVHGIHKSSETKIHEIIQDAQKYIVNNSSVVVVVVV